MVSVGLEPSMRGVCSNELVGGALKQGFDVDISLEDGNQKVLGSIKGRDREAPGKSEKIASCLNSEEWQTCARMKMSGSWWGW
jgi:hypothetical protein